MRQASPATHHHCRSCFPLKKHYPRITKHTVVAAATAHQELRVTNQDSRCKNNEPLVIKTTGTANQKRVRTKHHASPRCRVPAPPTSPLPVHHPAACSPLLLPSPAVLRSPPTSPPRYPDYHHYHHRCHPLSPTGLFATTATQRASEGPAGTAAILPQEAPTPLSGPICRCRHWTKLRGCWRQQLWVQ